MYECYANTFRALRKWAERKKIVTRLNFYGSRERGDYRTDSDLDICVEILGDDGEACGSWIFEEDTWKKEVAALSPYKIHLVLYDTKNQKLLSEIHSHRKIIYQSDI